MGAAVRQSDPIDLRRSRVLVLVATNKANTENGLAFTARELSEEEKEKWTAQYASSEAVGIGSSFTLEEMRAEVKAASALYDMMRNEKDRRYLAWSFITTHQIERCEGFDVARVS